MKYLYPGTNEDRYFHLGEELEISNSMKDVDDRELAELYSFTKYGDNVKDSSKLLFSTSVELA